MNDVENSLKEYLSIPFDDALQSKNMIIKGLAMIDRRLGIRRLANIELPLGEFDFIVTMYMIRCESEGIEPRNPNINKD